MKYGSYDTSRIIWAILIIISSAWFSPNSELVGKFQKNWVHKLCYFLIFHRAISRLLNTPTPQSFIWLILCTFLTELGINTWAPLPQINSYSGQSVFRLMIINTFWNKKCICIKRPTLKLSGAVTRISPSSNLKNSNVSKRKKLSPGASTSKQGLKQDYSPNSSPIDCISTCGRYSNISFQFLWRSDVWSSICWPTFRGVIYIKEIGKIAWPSTSLNLWFVKARVFNFEPTVRNFIRFFSNISSSRSVWVSLS